MKIAIDGPSGAGKSYLAKQIAARLGIIYVDTGALYRTIGLAVKRAEIDPRDVAAVTALLGKIVVELTYVDGAQCVLLSGENVGDKIRTPEMSMYASAVSAIPAVREFLFSTQRSIAEKSSVVMDGRDIGTVILPDAEVKIFLTASNEARANRRYLELKAKGIETTPEKVLEEMIERDKNDSTREVAPAVAAPDAILLDNSLLDEEGTVLRALEIIRENIG
ncbi:MAG: (d)CMP kinase [Clostridia bacterium]|nr:(d)CMP kinase [Clostridia bacterium]